MKDLKIPRSMKCFTLVAAFCFLISGCAATNQSGESKSSVEPESAPSNNLENDNEKDIRSNGSSLFGEFKREWSFCVDGPNNRVICSVGYLVSNFSDNIVEIPSTRVYAVVNGKIFKADVQGLHSLDTGFISQSWNPGEQLKTGASFTVPRGEVIRKIFWADEASENKAGLKFNLNFSAVS